MVWSIYRLPAALSVSKFNLDFYPLLFFSNLKAIHCNHCINPLVISSLNSKNPFSSFSVSIEFPFAAIALNASSILFSYSTEKATPAV